MRSNLFLLLCLLVLQVSFGQKGPLQDAAPETVGMSKERLARLDQLMQRYVDEKRLPGIAAIVVRDGRIIYHKAFGKRDLDAGDPLERDDIFRIASMSKAITSTAVMMLFEEGKFALDDPISKYIPGFRTPRVLVDYNKETGVWNSIPAKSEITIRQLMDHTSGIGYGNIGGSRDLEAIYEKAGVYNLFTTDDIALGDNIKRLAALPLLHHPGERFTYGMNTDVLGYLVEVLSGLSLDEFFRTRIFVPLGMNDTYFYLPDSKKERLVPVYTESGTPKSLQKWPVQKGYDPDYPVKGAKKLYSGGAGLSSTARDYAVFLQMILNGGEYNGKRLLSRKTVELMTSNQLAGLPAENRSDFAFSLAFQMVTPDNAWRDPGSIGKLSWGGYFSTHYFADPRERLVAVVMKQLQGENRGGDIWPLFQAILYGAFTD